MKALPVVYNCGEHHSHVGGFQCVPLQTKASLSCSQCGHEMQKALTVRLCVLCCVYVANIIRKRNILEAFALQKAEDPASLPFWFLCWCACVCVCVGTCKAFAFPRVPVFLSTLPPTPHFSRQLRGSCSSRQIYGGGRQETGPRCSFQIQYQLEPLICVRWCVCVACWGQSLLLRSRLCRAPRREGGEPPPRRARRRTEVLRCSP